MPRQRHIRPLARQTVVARPTRGKTAPERLRRTDVLAVLLGAPPRSAPLMVDVGFGATATTTLESYERLRGRCPDLRVIGVEIDRDRVAAAAAQPAPDAVGFRFGGFDLPLHDAERGRAGLIRAMNVLRQYSEAEHAPAVAMMGRQLAEGGVLIEGTSTPSGRLFTANLVRCTAGALAPIGVVLSVNLRRPWEPRELQTVLPKNLIHHAEPGGAIDAAFHEWSDAVADARRQRLTAASVFARAARRAAPAFGGADLRPALLERGYFLTRLVTPAR